MSRAPRCPRNRRPSDQPGRWPSPAPQHKCSGLAKCRVHAVGGVRVGGDPDGRTKGSGAATDARDESCVAVATIPG
jgi:hypothetical protein